MHRRGFDLQLTQYDEHDGHRVGTDAAARDAAAAWKALKRAEA